MKGLIFLIPLLLTLLGCKEKEEEMRDLEEMVRVESEETDLIGHLDEQSNQEFLIQQPFDSPARN